MKYNLNNNKYYILNSFQKFSFNHRGKFNLKTAWLFMHNTKTIIILDKNNGY